ncbi:hypothetical protein MOMA_02665 [Moraxella macacae 0408225]|uniref:Uncharacterized protein n=1 Tax=Moraxella macacae 0408225 TaxID=1230338 RepID=L2F8A4_9GAMM|nr:hypothetical protein MOMA_02665 [Moraxella macacae 0408225]
MTQEPKSQTQEPRKLYQDMTVAEQLQAMNIALIPKELMTEEEKAQSENFLRQNQDFLDSLS